MCNHFSCWNSLSLDDEWDFSDLSFFLFFVQSMQHQNIFNIFCNLQIVECNLFFTFRELIYWTCFKNAIFKWPLKIHSVLFDRLAGWLILSIFDFHSVSEKFFLSFLVISSPSVLRTFFHYKTPSTYEWDSLYRVNNISHQFVNRKNRHPFKQISIQITILFISLLFHSF